MPFAWTGRTQKLSNWISSAPDMTYWLTVCLSVCSVRGRHVHTTPAPSPVFCSYSRGQLSGSLTATASPFCPEPCHRLILLHHSITSCTFQCHVAHSAPSHADFGLHPPLSITTYQGSIASTPTSLGFQQRLWRLWQDRTTEQVNTSQISVDIYEATQSNIPEDSNFYLKFKLKYVCYSCDLCSL